MALQNITPQLQAEERTAQFHLHPVPIQNGLAQTGRMLTDAGQGLQKASFGLMLGLKRQKDEMDAREDALALAEAKNGYINEMAKKTTGLMQKSGTEARGITGQYEIDSGNAFNRWQTGLSMKAAREFKLWADQQHLTGWQRVQGYELSNVKGAQLEQGKQLLASGAQMFSTHGDFRTLAMLTQDAAAQYELQFGATEDQEALDKYVQGYIDQAYGARMDYLLKNGLYAQAEEFYDSLGKDGMPEPSASSRDTMRTVLDNSFKELRTLDAASVAYDAEVKPAGGDYSYGGYYATPDQEVAFAEAYDKRMRSQDPEDHKVAKAMAVLHQQNVAVQRAHLAADKAQTMGNLGDWSDPYQARQNLLQLRNVIAKMGPSVLRDELTDEYNKYESAIEREEKARAAEDKAARNEAKAEERQLAADWKEWQKEFNDDPERKGYVGALKLRLAMSDPTVRRSEVAPQPYLIRYGEATYDAKDDAQFMQMLNDLSWRNGGFLTDKDIGELINSRRMGFASVERVDAAGRVASVLNELNDVDTWTGELAAVAAPQLVDDIVKKVYQYTSGGAKKDADIDKAISQIILTKLSEERNQIAHLGVGTITLGKWLGKGLNADGTFNADFDQKHFSYKYQTLQQRVSNTMGTLRSQYNSQGGRDNYTLESQAAAAAETIAYEQAKPNPERIEAQERAYVRQEEIDEWRTLAHQALEEGLDEATFKRQLENRWTFDVIRGTRSPRPMVPDKRRMYNKRIDEILSYYREQKQQREGK